MGLERFAFVRFEVIVEVVQIFVHVGRSQRVCMKNMFSRSCISGNRGWKRSGWKVLFTELLMVSTGYFVLSSSRDKHSHLCHLSTSLSVSIAFASGYASMSSFGNAAARKSQTA